MKTNRCALCDHHYPKLVEELSALCSQYHVQALEIQRLFYEQGLGRKASPCETAINDLVDMGK